MALLFWRGIWSEEDKVFRVFLLGEGETVEEAWDDAVEHFSLDPGPPVDDYVIKKQGGELCLKLARRIY